MVTHTHTHTLCLCLCSQEYQEVRSLHTIHESDSRTSSHPPHPDRLHLCSGSAPSLRLAAPVGCTWRLDCILKLPSWSSPPSSLSWLCPFPGTVCTKDWGYTCKARLGRPFCMGYCVQQRILEGQSSRGMPRSFNFIKYLHITMIYMSQCLVSMLQPQHEQKSMYF